VHVAPRPDPRLEWASTALDTRHGRIEVSWRSEGNTVTVDVSLPPGVTGLLDLPGQPLMELDSGQHRHVKNL
jgi:alpha-L-rhamnosidase